MKIRSHFRWLAACALLVVFAPVQAFFTSLPTSIVEYQNELTGHYLLLTADDALLVDRGLAGPGWGRTGYYFVSYDGFNGSVGQNVCRFYSPANNSHFFTAHAAECDILQRTDSGWIFEKYPFRIEIPTASGCPAYEKPVYRLYNNRHLQHDANHRYTADLAVRSAMQAAGWADEGVAFCAGSAGVGPDTSIELQPIANAAVPVTSMAECERRLGMCVGLSQLALMPNSVASWLPPFYVTKNPAFPWDRIGAYTGLDQPIFTTTPPGSSELLSHSFVQVVNSPVGVYIRGAERTEGVYAGASPMRVLPGVASSAGDERIFPWRGTRDRTLVVNTELAVPRVLRSDGAAHAYGHPMLQFADQRSGRSFFVTLQTFGTLPAGDYVGPDATTGWAIVSTSFRADPLFGRRLAGDYVQCDPSASPSCIPARTAFKFAIDRAAFQAVVDRARSVDPALSANVSDFFLASFRMHNETYLDAELGMALYRMNVAVFVEGAPSN